MILEISDSLSCTVWTICSTYKLVLSLLTIHSHLLCQNNISLDTVAIKDRYYCRHIRWVGFWRFASLQHLRSYQDWSRLVKVSTHGNFLLLGNQATKLMTQYPTQSYYPDTELTSPRPILSMQNVRLGNNRYQLYKSLHWLDREPKLPISHTRGPCAYRFSHHAQWHVRLRQLTHAHRRTG